MSTAPHSRVPQAAVGRGTGDLFDITPQTFNHVWASGSVRRRMFRVRCWESINFFSENRARTVLEPIATANSSNFLNYYLKNTVSAFR